MSAVNHKAKSDNPTLIKFTVQALVGSLFNIIIFFSLVAVLSLICLKIDCKTAIYKYFVFFISAISGFVGGLIAVKPFRKNGLIIGALSSVPAFIIIFLISSIISTTGIGVFGFISAIVMTLFSAIGGIISVNKRK